MRRSPTFAWASPATAPPGACWSDSARPRTTRARSPSTRVRRMRWYIVAAAAVAAIAVAVACGQGSGGSKNIISPEDAGVDAGPVGDAGPADAGDGGIDGGADAGPGSSAFVGYQGKEGCEDEWDRYLPDHGRANPSIYKSGDVDKVVLSGGGIRVAHYDIFSGPGEVGGEPAGREKLCTIYRILWQRGTRYVWFGGNHGYALGFADYEGNPGCNGHRGCSGNYEHSHPAINDSHRWFITGGYYGIAIDTWAHVDGQGNTFFDVWFGGRTRTTRFRMGEELGDFWRAQLRTELYVR